jgi:flagellar motor switch protein FliM
LRVEFEKYLSAFLRKRIIVKTDICHFSQASACLNANEKLIYSIFRINPKDHYGMVLIDFPVLHQTINLLYGGKLNTKEEVIDNPGKVGTIIAEKTALLCLNGFAAACQEFGALNYDIVKTTSSYNLATNLGLNPEDEVCITELTIFFDEFEAKIKLLITEDFFMQFIPVKADSHKHREKDFWRTAIKTQVVDSLVTVSVSLPDVSMKVKDFMALKDGDIVPISDPTIVYVCLNNLKLFRATAGQANSKRVVKILNQI